MDKAEEVKAMSSGIESNDLNFRVRGIPATVSEPCEFLLDGASLYQSHSNGPINAEFGGNIKGYAQKGDLQMKIRAMGYDQVKTFDLTKGRCITIAAKTSGQALQMSVTQHVRFD